MRIMINILLKRDAGMRLRDRLKTVGAHRYLIGFFICNSEP